MLKQKIKGKMKDLCIKPKLPTNL